MESIYKLGRIDSGTIYEADGYIFKTLDRQFINDFQNFFENGCYNELKNSNIIVETSIVSVNGEYFFKQRKLELISYPREWSINMLSEASNSVLKICHTLKKFGFYIMDCHGYNIIFDNCRPIIVDIGGIRKDTHNNKFTVAPLLEYYVSYIIPFYIWNMCGEKVGKASLPTIGNFIKISDYLSLKHPLMRNSISKIIGYLLYYYINFITLGYKEIVQKYNDKFYTAIVTNLIFQYSSLIMGSLFLGLSKIKNSKFKNKEKYLDIFTIKYKFPKIELSGTVAEVCYSKSITLLDSWESCQRNINRTTLISDHTSCDLFIQRIKDKNHINYNVINTDIFSTYMLPGELSLKIRLNADYLIYSAIDHQSIKEIIKYSNEHIYNVLTSLASSGVYFVIDSLYIDLLPSNFLKDLAGLENFKIIWISNDKFSNF
jgi:hypothetical protein